MKDIKLKNLILICLAVLAALFGFRPYIEKGLDHINLFDNQAYLVDFIDDSDVRIKMKSYAKQIISLDSSHTENLFSLNLENEIIGVSKSDNYPIEVLNKKVYDYMAEPEKIIAANPDLVLVTPFIEKENPDFVKTLRRTGINVVSIYPVEYGKFSDYIEKLGMLTGKKNTAQILLQNFYDQIKEIEEMTKNIDKRAYVFVESDEIGYKTVTLDSFASNAIKIAGGINIAQNAARIDDKSYIAEFGMGKIRENADKIDIYLSQIGGRNSGGKVHSIEIRPEFNDIKAVKNERVYNINENLISYPTLRYLKGIKELCRIFHPDVFDDISVFASEKEITRELLAEISVKYAHKGIYIPSSSYYRTEHEGHAYGFFEDVSLEHERFDFIETAVLSGYMESFKEDGVEMFYPENNVTRDEFAKTVYLIGDISKKEVHKKIDDIDEIKNKRIVQDLVDNGVFSLKNGRFNPKEFVTVNEVIEVFNRLGKVQAK